MFKRIKKYIKLRQNENKTLKQLNGNISNLLYAINKLNETTILTLKEIHGSIHDLLHELKKKPIKDDE